MHQRLLGLALFSSLGLTLSSLSVAAETPLQAVMAERNVINQIELSNVSLTQTLNRVESADEAVVTLIEANLLDDAIAAVKNVYFLKRDDSGWSIDQTHSFQQCRRGDTQQGYTQKRCP